MLGRIFSYSDFRIDGQLTLFSLCVFFMASPLLNQLKKTLSPRSPIMRLKSPFKVNTSRKSPLTLKSSITSPLVAYSPRKLFDDVTSFAIKIPKIRQVLALETKINNLLENGIDEKNCYVLGKGSFGTVILSSLKGKKVAVKIVKNNSDQCTMKREQNALILSHPNVVEVIQVIHNPKTPFGIVVMDPWSPLTLQAVVDESINIGFEESIRLIIGICAALSYCHEVGIVHLDIKPKNILIDLKEMRSKLCDFGNSYNLKSSLPLPHIQGTVAYIAPELLKGKSVTDRCDVYSLGITMWQILHKEYPYAGLENHVIIYQVVANQYRPRTTVKSEGKGFIKLYEKCWLQEPSDRPPISTVEMLLQSMI